VTTEDAIRSLEEAIRDAPRSRLLEIVGDCARLEAMARALFAQPEEDDGLINALEAAPLLGISAATLYREADRYPFTVREGRRLRFSRAGLRNYLKRAS
jgi:predicted DNA-binding transcriptional regulator AlpA